MSKISSGVQGAQLGGQLGGAWGAVGGGLLGFLLGGSEDKAQRKQTEEWNKQVQKQATADLFDMQRNNNIENIRTSQALDSYNQNKKVQGATINASLGAADIIGSSAQALVQTIDYQTSAAKAAVWDNFETNINNYNTSIAQQTNQRVSSLKYNPKEQVDWASLATSAFSTYKNTGGKEAWGDVKEDAQYVWDNRQGIERAINTTGKAIGKNVAGYVGYAGTSLIGNFKTIWETGSLPMGSSVGSRINSSINAINSSIRNK